MKNENIIADFLKKNDIERYYSSILIDKKHRASVQVLFAFNAEISTISLKVSEPKAGEIRLVWWREILEGKRKEEAEQNPIAFALLKMLNKYNLSKLPLISLIEARHFDLYNDKMDDMVMFEGYAGEVFSIIYQYVAQILNNGKPLENGNAAGHIGVAHALIIHINSFAFNASRMQLFLPYAVFQTHGINEKQIFAMQENEKFNAVMTDFLQITNEHLNKAKAAIKLMPKNTKSSFAYIGVLEKQIKLIKKSNKNNNGLQISKSLANIQILLQLFLWTLKNTK